MKRSDMRSDLEFLVYSSTIKNNKNVKLKYETLKLPYVIEKYYLPDFVIEGTDIVVEVKGYFRATDRTKMLAVKKANPNLDIRFVFPQDNKLFSRSKTRYSDWCEKNGFKYHIGTEIPKEWLTRKKKKVEKGNRNRRRSCKSKVREPSSDTDRKTNRRRKA